MSKRYLINEIYDHKYVKIPKELFINPKYTHLTSDAKILYALLLDRMELSKKNNWINERGEIYLIMTREEIQNFLNISDKTATKIMNQLKEVGLIEEERQGRGLPNLIYICHIEHEDISSDKSCKSYDSRLENFTSQESENLRGNKTNINNTDINKTDNNNNRVVVEKNGNKKLIERVESIIGQKIEGNILESIPNEMLEQALETYQTISANYKVHNPAGFFIYLAKNKIKPPRPTGGRRSSFDFEQKHDWTPEDLEALWEPIG